MTDGMDLEGMAMDELRRRYKPLDAATEAVLIVAAKAGDDRAMERLFHSMSSLAIDKAYKACKDGSHPADHLGLQWEAFVSCVRRFDPSKGYRLSTFFGQRAEGCVKDETRKKLTRKKHEEGKSLVHTPHKREDQDQCLNDIPEELAFGFVPKDESIESRREVGIAKVLACLKPGSKERALIEALLGVVRGEPASQAQLAKLLGCSRQNVNALYQKALIIIRRELGIDLASL